MRAHLDQRAAHRHARHDLTSDRACRYARRSLARRLTTAAPIVADAIFGIVSIISVPRPVFVLDLRIVLRALVDVVDDECNRRPRCDLFAGRFVSEYARENFHLVWFAPLRGETRLARPSFVEIGLDVGLGQRDARRATVDHTTDRDSVAFAERRDPEKVTEGIERHGVPPAGVW
jgi:hypothetical protein